MPRTCLLSSSSNSRDNLNYPIEQAKKVATYSKSHSTFPGILRPNNLGIKAEPIRSSDGWNKQEEVYKHSSIEMISNVSKQNTLQEAAIILNFLRSETQILHLLL